MWKRKKEREKKEKEEERNAVCVWRIKKEKEIISQYFHNKF